MQIGAYFVAIVILIIIMLSILFVTYKQLNQKAAKEVFITMLINIFALFCFALSLLFIDDRLKFVFHELKFLSLAFLAPSILFIYLRFTDQMHIMTIKRKILLFIIPCLTVVLALTNDYHHLFRANMQRILHNGIFYTYVDSSVWYWVHSVYSYVLYCTGIGVLISMYIKKPSIYRGHIGLMITTNILAICVSISSVLGLFIDYGDIALVSCSFVSILQYMTIVKYSHPRIIQQVRNMIIDDINNPVLIFDHKNVLIDMNKKAAMLLEELEITLIGDILSKEKGFYKHDNSIIYLSHSDIYFRISDKPILDEKKLVIGRVIVLDDVTVLEKTAMQLTYIATHDELTGLKNRQAFHFSARKIQESDLPACFIYLNISGTKLINAIFGNEYGDAVIKRVAGVIKDTGVECARLNGDDFGIIMKNASVEDAEALVKNLNSLLMVSSESEHIVRVSGGISVMTDMSSDVEVVLSAAASSVNKNLEYTSLVTSSFIETSKNMLAKMFDPTGSRMGRIKSLCVQIAEHLSLSDIEISNLSLLSDIHDIGLISTPQGLLQNIGNLTNEQWEEIKLHTIKGYSIALSIPALANIADEILMHHERYDGFGYPNGQKADDIPILSRILSAAEYYVDSPEDQALTMLQKRRGTQFDPNIVDIIVNLL